MKLSNQLKAWRKRRNLTQAQAAALLWAMPLRTFQQYEQDVQSPPDWVARAVMERIKL
jgi:transcriptional regulator with XRE-family HTH domain